MRAIIISLLMIFLLSPLAQAEKKIIINLASRTLSLYDNNERIHVYPLGVGKVSTPTPVGYYSILNKEIDPPWIDPTNPEYEVPSGANNPLGYRWMQIQGNYGIHGTNRPDSIGFYVSNGCIRMREADVEELFDAVEVGTPVEITYNRVVVEKATDGQIVYYIYPDGYSRQALDVKYVNSWIEPWGVSAFAEDSEIATAIRESVGEPIYIGKAYNLEINNKIVPATVQNNRHFDSKAVERGGIIYLPAVPIAIAMEMKLEWRYHTTLATKFGEVPGIEKKGQLYLNEDDASILFKTEGWREGNTYKLKSLPADEKPPIDDNKDDQTNKKSDTDQTKDNEKSNDQKEIKEPINDPKSDPKSNEDDQTNEKIKISEDDNNKKSDEKKKSDKKSDKKSKKDSSKNDKPVGY